MSYIRFGSKVSGQRGSSGAYAYSSCNGGVEISGDGGTAIVTHAELRQLIKSFRRQERHSGATSAAIDARLDVARLERDEQIASITTVAGEGWLVAGGPRELCASCNRERRDHDGDPPEGQARHRCPAPLAFRSRNPITYATDGLPCCGSEIVMMRLLEIDDGNNGFCAWCSQCPTCEAVYGSTDLVPPHAGGGRETLRWAATELERIANAIKFDLRTDEPSTSLRELVVLLEERVKSIRRQL